MSEASPALSSAAAAAPAMVTPAAPALAKESVQPSSPSHPVPGSVRSSQAPTQSPSHLQSPGRLSHASSRQPSQEQLSQQLRPTLQQYCESVIESIKEADDTYEEGEIKLTLDWSKSVHNTLVFWKLTLVVRAAKNSSVSWFNLSLFSLLKLPHTRTSLTAKRNN